MTDRPPLPPFSRETALQKVQAAEDAWNTRDPERVAAAYSADSVWRNRDRFIAGRDEIVAFLTGKWQREVDYALRSRSPSAASSGRGRRRSGVPSFPFAEAVVKG
jgi:nuclear transport factor 2 (NTF2) superfamily protein